MKHTKLFCTILVVSMLFSLVSCGEGNSKTKDPNLLKIGDYEILYKSAKIREASDGNDLLVLTMDFTNNSKEPASYLWSIFDWAVQDGTELEYADTGVYSLFEVTNSQIEDVAPGKTFEIYSAFVLTNTTNEVEVFFEEMDGDENDKITIDLSTLSWESEVDVSGAPSLAGGSTTEAPSDGKMRDWWNDNWYGWWIMTDCWGDFEDMEGQWWDICGNIDIGEDGIGIVTLWDVDYTKEEPMVSASVSLNEAGTSEIGTMMSEGGWFMDVPLEYADWIVDPGLVDYPDMIHIDGYYENDYYGFSYNIYLRPWGTYWDDVAEENLPAFYDDWYLPLIEAGEPMPDSIG